MSSLPYDNVTVLYGHIHRDDEHMTGNVHHYAARSLIFGFPDPIGRPGRESRFLSTRITRSRISDFARWPSTAKRNRAQPRSRSRMLN